MNDDDAVQAGENNMRHSHATHDLFMHLGSGKEEVWVSKFCFVRLIEFLPMPQGVPKAVFCPVNNRTYVFQSSKHAFH